MGGGNVKTVTSVDDFLKIVSDSAGKNIIVDFTATWCGPCKMISPYFTELSEKFTNLIFVKCDVDEVEELASVCGVSAMPTFQVYGSSVTKDTLGSGKVDEVVGATKQKLEAICAKHSA